MEALATFAGMKAKAAKLRVVLAGIETEQRLALGKLAELAGLELAARLTGMTVAAVRDALGEQRRHAEAAGDTDAAAAPGGQGRS